MSSIVLSVAIRHRVDPRRTLEKAAESARADVEEIRRAVETRDLSRQGARLRKAFYGAVLDGLTERARMA